MFPFLVGICFLNDHHTSGEEVGDNFFFEGGGGGGGDVEKMGELLNTI